MNGDSGLVVTLVDRLTTRLPHRTGSSLHDFNRDEIVVLTRGTLVGISSSCIGVVVDALVQLLEELSRPFKGIQAHPPHVPSIPNYTSSIYYQNAARFIGPASTIPIP
ncbi:hypothetical protein PZA11_008005 [Diplocarpon coronariae]